MSVDRGFSVCQVVPRRRDGAAKAGTPRRGVRGRRQSTAPRLSVMRRLPPASSQGTLSRIPSGRWPDGDGASHRPYLPSENHPPLADTKNHFLTIATPS